MMGDAVLTARDVADYFLAHVDEDAGELLSNLKLQKLVYYAQGFHLALTGRPLFDEPIEAWTHGPVVPELYHDFKHHGSGGVPGPVEFDLAKYDEDTRGILDEVRDVYGQFSAWKLRDMTHDEPPWRDTPSGGVIPHEAMREYFATLVKP